MSSGYRMANLTTNDSQCKTVMLIGYSDASVTPITMNQHIANDDFYTS